MLLARKILCRLLTFRRLVIPPAPLLSGLGAQAVEASYDPSLTNRRTNPTRKLLINQGATDLESGIIDVSMSSTFISGLLLRLAFAIHHSVSALTSRKRHLTIIFSCLLGPLLLLPELHQNAQRSR